MRETDNIKHDLGKVYARIKELRPQSDAQRSALTDAEGAFASGTIGQDQLETEAMRESLLFKTVQALRADMIRLEKEYEEAIVSETRTIILDHMHRAAKESSSMFQGYINLRSEFGHRRRSKADISRELLPKVKTHSLRDDLLAELKLSYGEQPVGEQAESRDRLSRPRLPESYFENR